MRTLSEERRQAIITAAAAVFQEQGYERTSMSEVARRAGGSKATLYNYFTSKEALFESVVRTYSTQFLTRGGSRVNQPAKPDAYAGRAADALWRQHVAGADRG